MNPQTSTWTRHLLSLLVLIAGLLGLAVPATAQTNYTSDEINNAILLPGSIVPEWTQPEVPWQIDGDHIYAYSSYDHNSYITFSYTSDKPTLIKMYSSTYIGLYNAEEDTYYDEGYFWADGNCMARMEAGEVKLELRISYSSSNHYVSSFGIYELDENIDASKILTPKSKPIEFVNNAIDPWYVDGDGRLCTSRTSTGVASSKIKLKFTIDKISKLSWKENSIKFNSYYDELKSSLDIYINDIKFDSKGVGEHAEVFLPGTYEIEFIDNQWNEYDSYGGCRVLQLNDIELNDEWFEVTTTAGDLGNCVIDEISKYGYSILEDVEMLKINGKLNSNDWQRISQMINLKALDIKDTDVTVIPSSQFKDNSMLTYINFPTGLKTIEKESFSGSNLKYLTLPEGLEYIGEKSFLNNRIQEVEIPASVETIWRQAFDGSWLRKLTFAPNSQFKNMGYLTFQNCNNLESVELPDSLEYFDTSTGNIYEDGTFSEYWNDYNQPNGAFAYCGNLKSIKFPKHLKSIPQVICTNNRNLANVEFPEDLETIEIGAFMGTNLKNVTFPSSLKTIGIWAFKKHSRPEDTYTVDFPESLTAIDDRAFENGNFSEVSLPLHLKTIGSGAFTGNANMKKIRLHSGAKNLPKFLSGCNALETIVLPCATPPTRIADILGSQDKKKINLIVPDFARTSYALDAYWYLFGSITSGDEADVQDYWNVIGDLVLREGRRMFGVPEVEISNGASVTVIGDAPATFGDLIFNFDENAPASFVNNCPNASAESIQVRFAVKANRWYMFTPMFDVNVSDIIVTNTNNYVFRYYDAAHRAEGNVNTDGSSENWKNVTDPQLKAGVGYIFQCDADSEMIFPEASISNSRVLSTTQCDIALESHEAESIANADWNFIGNPYPAYFDIWYLDVEAPITIYSKNEYGTGQYSALSVTDDEYILRPMEAFFIQKPEVSPEAIFHIDGRQATKIIGDHTSHSAPARHAAAKKAERNLFNIQLSDKEGNELDRTRVVINEAASMDYEIRCDAAKFMSTGAQLYTIDPEGIQMAINERPLADGEVALGVTTGDDRQYTIEASRADGDVWLIDLKTGAEHDLTAAPYTLFADPNSTIEGRYALRFRPAETGVGGNIIAKARVEAGIGYISIENPKEEAVIVYGLDGSETFRTSDAAARIDMAAGIYLVRLGSKTHKVIVK